MALRQALARGLAHLGRPAGQQVAGLCTEQAAGLALAPAKSLLSSAHHSLPATAGAAAAAAVQGAQRAGSLRSLLRLPSGATAGAGACAPGSAASGLRQYGSSARETLHEAAERVRSAAASSANAVRAAADTAAKVPGAVFQALPTSAKQLVNATQTPGAVNRVVSLQLTAFWQNHSGSLIAGGAVLACYAIWRLMYKTSQLFVTLSGDVATLGFFSLAASMVAGGYLYLRRRYTIDPSAVYRLAMYRLNTNPGLLEVMGAPLVGSPVQASVLTGGGIHFKGLRPRLQSKRVQMIFPLKGAERRGLVSLEAKKRHGQLRFKLLAVDVPSVSGGEQRIYLEGGPSLYERGGVLNVLRDPFIRALSLEHTFQAEDEAEDAEEERERQVAAQQRAAAAAAKQPKPLDQGGGLYFYEKVMLGARRALAGLNKQQQQQAAPGPAVGLKPAAAPSGAPVTAAAAAAAAARAA